MKRTQCARQGAGWCNIAATSLSHHFAAFTVQTDKTMSIVVFVVNIMGAGMQYGRFIVKL